MAAKSSAYLLCCFVITSNIKIIESAGNHQITPIRFFVQTCFEEYVCTVNDLKTFNKHPISIKPAEQKMLSTRACNNINDYQLKLKSRDKLEKKAQDVKCSFCVITKSNILNMKNLIENVKSGEPFIDNEKTVKDLKEEVEIIIHLLLLANIETGKWLWSYYLKIIAISQYYDNKPFIHENPFEDHQLQTDVSDFIENCVAENYLPLTTMESDLVSKKQGVYKDMFSDLRDSGMFSGILNGRVVLVTITFLYLKPFWDDGNQLLFRQITGADVDWSKAKQRHEVEVTITRKFVENRTWMYIPYGRLDHQHLLVKIVDARLYCYVSVVLNIYEKQLSILEGHTLTRIKVLVCHVIQYALKVTAYKDDFLVDILSEFKFAKINDTNEIEDVSARVKAKADEILNDLNSVSKNNIDWLSFVSVHQLSTDDLIMRIIKDFKDYLHELKRLCLPFEYKVFLHFIDVIKSSVAQYI
ncbi:uncharacterized protein LOC126847593 [Adelges cooleyi]|uniref:uncharacterized protein LOC126847593 n=1 Tax=Adelges cooleyi TaxID=133065 RepID=UPI0021805C81|nr:uncharacterized protein LOC126847593 [Adelges cooleyi]